jgi:hypothetical protein
LCGCGAEVPPAREESVALEDMEGRFVDEPPDVARPPPPVTPLPIPPARAAGSCGRGMPASVLRRFLPDCVARLNICGIRALLRDELLEPSGGCMDWYVSNSEKRALRALRNSVDVWACRSVRTGREKPRRR